MGNMIYSTPSTDKAEILVIDENITTDNDHPEIVFLANVLIGKTIKEANLFVTDNKVYFKDGGTRITEVDKDGLKDLRCEPGNFRLNVQTNRFGKIDTIVDVG